MESSEGKMIAKCGLICGDCLAFIATQENNEIRIAEIAKQWSIEFKTIINPGDVWCDGCLVEARKCSHCAECEVRKCATFRNIDNCAVCAEFDKCATITKFMAFAPAVKPVLESIRNNFSCNQNTPK